MLENRPKPKWFIARRGLHELMNSLEYRDPGGKYKYPVDIEKHPLNLLVPTREKGEDSFEHRPKSLLFFGWPFYTDISVKNFLKHIAEHFQINPAIPSEVIYLREMFVKGYVFFEVGFLTETIMCGGCTDGGGAGGEGRKVLESVFELLALTNNLFVEKIEVTSSGAIEYLAQLIEQKRKELQMV